MPEQATCGVIFMVRWGGRHAGDWVPGHCDHPLPCPDHPDPIATAKAVATAAQQVWWT